MRTFSVIAIALVLFAASMAQTSAKELSNEATRNLLQEEEASKDCSDLSFIEKTKCLAANAADSVADAAGAAGSAIADTYNSVVGNDKADNATAANGTAPSSSAVATSGFAAVAVATVFALAY